MVVTTEFYYEDMPLKKRTPLEKGSIKSGYHRPRFYHRLYEKSSPIIIKVFRHSEGRLQIS